MPVSLEDLIKSQTALKDEERLTTQLLPALAFTGNEALTEERQQIFEANWMCIGFASEIPHAGDMRPLHVLDMPLFLVRGKDNVVRVFHNVCRHRGHQLLAEPTNRKLITCPYHSWSYGLDGNFRSAPYWMGKPDAKPGDDICQQLSLNEVRTEVWCDMVFINLDGNAQAFDEFIAPLDQRWQAYPTSEFYLADTQNYEVEGNWKFVIENFLDNYHFPITHAQFGTYEVMLQITHLRISNDIFGYHMPTGEADKPKTGTPLIALDLSEALMPAQDILYLYPNTLLIMTATWFQVINLMPVTPGHTEETLAVYLVKSESPSDALQQTRDDFIRAANYINEQDLPVLKGLQAGMQSRAASHGQYIPVWDENPYRLHQRLQSAIDYKKFRQD